MSYLVDRRHSDSDRNLLVSIPGDCSGVLFLGIGECNYYFRVVLIFFLNIRKDGFRIDIYGSRQIHSRCGDESREALTSAKK